MAQALQFECGLTQKDVIGEWVPLSEMGSSEILRKKQKWLRGLRWTNIDQNWILRLTTFSGKDVEIDLKKKPMVMDELSKRGGVLPASGAVVVCETTGTPWAHSTFRVEWRKIADAAKVPKEVKNMDSRGRKSQAA